ncbi:MAG TPA: hypothetical protein ENK47_03775 [Euryarchaeota archaeon]|nr:MAG: hypothetical protein DRN57_03165 [Thermoplasmata archaeon]HHD15806.1 hypothetical protein [Euryarchaeota archaeon]
MYGMLTGDVKGDASGSARPGTVFILLAMALISLLMAANVVSAIDETTVNLTIAPGEKDGAYLPALDTDTIDVKMTSNIPVDVYIITQDQVYDALISDDFDYEKKWEDRTSLNVNYRVEDQNNLYYILIHNTDSSETAEVELEYKVIQEILEEAAKDAAKGICCGSVFLPLVGIGALVVLARKHP